MHASRTAWLAAALAVALAGAGTAAAQTAPPAQPPPQPQPQQSMPAPSGPQATDTKPGFDTLDKNGDGRLTRSEVPEDLRDLRAHFREYDRDHDGKLSPPEYGMYASPPPENMRH